MIKGINWELTDYTVEYDNSRFPQMEATIEVKFDPFELELNRPISTLEIVDDLRTRIGGVPYVGSTFSELIRKHYCGTPELKNHVPIIKKAIFSPPATILLWEDGTKTVVKCQNGEPYDAEKGFTMAYMKKIFGNKGKFNDEIHKWVTEEVEDSTKSFSATVGDTVDTAMEEVTVPRENVDYSYMNWLISRVEADTGYTGEARRDIITALKHYYGV